MPFSFLVVLALWCTAQSATVQGDSIVDLVVRLEKAVASGNREAIQSLGHNPDALSDFALALTVPQPSRIVIKERDRTRVDSGGHRLLLEVFWERGIEGRLSTWSVDLVQEGSGWRFAAASRLAHVTGLYRLRLNAEKQFEVRDLTVRGPDLTLHLRSGSAFVADTPEGTTAVVLLGNGEARFSPPDPAERTQVRIFSGNEALISPFNAVFIRVRPEDFAGKFSAASLIERTPNPSDIRRATAVFEEYVQRTLHINLMDLSNQRWSITPQPGDMIAEIRTKRLGSLTYTRSNADPEDVTLFDRKKRRNISVYTSAEKLERRGRFYSEDDRVDYDILAYDLDVAIAPEANRIEGTARFKIKIRALSTSTLNLRLAEALAVRGVFSPGFGRLLHLRIVNQNSLIVSLPATMLQGTEMWLSITYGGTIAPQELDREAITVAQQEAMEPVQIPAEPRFLFSNRSYWYPQSIVSDYATATLRITVPENFDVVASGLATGPPAPPAGVVEGPSRRTFIFEADRPVRYLACVISRFREVGSTAAKLEALPQGLPLNIQANARQVSRARGMASRAADIFGFYASLLGDAPYPGFTLAVTERELPGGHSPAYFAVVDQPQRGPASWRNDPVNFDTYPAFFVAHEIAHQWWGQAVGWKNYHEQWLSEGFAQYFAALYAERKISPDVMNSILRQMRQTAINQSGKGPVYLGYRLGHVQGDSRVFRSIIYNKAAMVLHMLRRLIGEDAFFRGVREFYTEFKYRKAGTDDLITVMERASGRDLKRFFESWVFNISVPEPRFSYKSDGSKVVVRLEQTAPAVEFPVTVRLTYMSGRTQDVVVIASALVTERSIELLEPLRSVSVNEDHGSLIVIR